MTGLDPRPVLVAGASGFVGSHIVRLLVERGRKVRVLLRKTSSIKALQGMPIEVIYGDVLDTASLRLAMRGCGTVFYSVVDPRFWLSDQTPLVRNNVEGLDNAMDAALDCGITRFIFTSSMGTLGLNPDGPVTEDIPFNWMQHASPYIRTRLEAEQRFLACCRDRKLPGVALCVANTYGPQDYQPTPHNGGLWDVASGKVKMGVAVSQPTVDIRDVAQAALLAEDRGRLGERYIIANAFVSNRDFFAMAVAETGQPMPRMMPYRAAWWLAWVVGSACKVLRIRDNVISTDAIYLANVFREMDNSKARRDLGWSPRSLTETVRDTVRWFSSQERDKRTGS